jgi:uncharacterized protein (DUF952 family)
MRVAYHLVAEDLYRAQLSGDVYRPEGYDREGFVHLTHGTEATLAVGNRYYRGDSRPYLLLSVDLGRVVAEVRYEDPDGDYPHVHGPIDRAAITAVHHVNRAPDGSFLTVGAAVPNWSQAGS